MAYYTPSLARSVTRLCPAHRPIDEKTSWPNCPQEMINLQTVRIHLNISQSFCKNTRLLYVMNCVCFLRLQIDNLEYKQ